MSDFKGPYLGFTYGGTHSSEFNIVRTSTSNRYNQNLSPDFSDKTNSVPGADQIYYFNTDFTQRTFTVPFAFDNIDEATLTRLKRWLDPKKNQQLVFDETPYKYYYAKPQSAVQFNYLAFDERHNGGAERVYKGEGTIQFICYYPFARSLYKSLEEWCDANDIEYSSTMDKPEWFDSQHLLNSAIQSGQIIIINKGDLPCDIRIFIETTGTMSVKLGIRGQSVVLGQLELENLSFETGDEAICIDSRTNLIYGATKDGDEYILNNNIYNKYIKSGTFFKAPLSENDEQYDIKISKNSASVNYIVQYDCIYY